MKMQKEDLIKARVATAELLSRTLHELMFSMICLISATTLIIVFHPEVLNKASGLIAILFGLVFGTVLGSARAYAIFWNKTEFKNPHGDVESEIQTKP